jgi:ribonuclease BN (tRNA processing enzyme)
MEITVLGSGTATPSLERNASGLVIRASNSWVLVDMGPGTMRRMCEAGLDSKSIDAILITHFHPDHVSDLVPFLFASNYGYGEIRKAPFHLVGPTGLEQFYMGLVGVYGDWIVPKGDRLIVKEVNANEPESFNLNGMLIHSRPAVHSFPSLHYRIEADGVSATVSGDTDFSEGLIALAQGTEVLICECSMPEGWKLPGHLVPLEAGRIAAQAQAKKLVLTHFYPPCEDADVISQAASVYSGEIVKARDLMVIAV